MIKLCKSIHHLPEAYDVIYSIKNRRGEGRERGERERESERISNCNHAIYTIDRLLLDSSSSICNTVKSPSQYYYKVVTRLLLHCHIVVTTLLQQ